MDLQQQVINPSRFILEMTGQFSQVLFVLHYETSNTALLQIAFHRKIEGSNSGNDLRALERSGSHLGVYNHTKLS